MACRAQRTAPETSGTSRRFLASGSPLRRIGDRSESSTAAGRYEFAGYSGALSGTTAAGLQRLVAAIELDPGAGIGKPERLRGNLAGLWSRRIDHHHRLVYRVEIDDDITVVSARFHHGS